MTIWRSGPSQKLHLSSDHHEEAAYPLHCQLSAARPVLLVSGLVVFPDLRQRRREAQLQGHRAARCHRAAADPE